jgi:hypothetical protein
VTGEGSLRQLFSHLLGQAPPVGQVDLFGAEVDVGTDCSGLDLSLRHWRSFR